MATSETSHGEGVRFGLFLKVAYCLLGLGLAAAMYAEPQRFAAMTLAPFHEIFGLRQGNLIQLAALFALGWALASVVASALARARTPEMDKHVA